MDQLLAKVAEKVVAGFYFGRRRSGDIDFPVNPERASVQKHFRMLRPYQIIIPALVSTGRELEPQTRYGMALAHEGWRRPYKKSMQLQHRYEKFEPLLLAFPSSQPTIASLLSVP